MPLGTVLPTGRRAEKANPPQGSGLPPQARPCALSGLAPEPSRPAALEPRCRASRVRRQRRRSPRPRRAQRPQRRRERRRRQRRGQRRAQRRECEGSRSAAWQSRRRPGARRWGEGRGEMRRDAEGRGDGEAERQGISRARILICFCTVVARIRRLRKSQKCSLVISQGKHVVSASCLHDYPQNLHKELRRRMSKILARKVPCGA